MTKRWIIGIDCAVDPRNVGVAKGVISGDEISLKEVTLCSRGRLPAATAAAYAKGHRDILFALDAPLGWPRAFGRALTRHKAGQPLEVPANHLFRRQTDDCVKENVGKRPLDIGADRIARTALDALAVLRTIGRSLGSHVELAWDEHARGPRAIEVYPAATLMSRAVPAPRYKRPEHTKGRRDIAAALGKLMRIECDRQILVESSHALDAAVCVLAGADFLRGQCPGPKDPLRSKKEGWIWVRDARLNLAP